MKYDPRSLRIKIILHVFFTSVLMLLLFGLILFTQINNVTREVTKENLLEQARKIASYIEYDWRGRLNVDLPGRYEEYYDKPLPIHQFAVMNPSGKILFQSRHFMNDQIQSTLDKGGKYFFNIKTDDEQSFAALKYDYLFEDKIYPIYVIENEQEFSNFFPTLQKGFMRNVLALGLPLLLLQGFFIIFVFRAAFKPVVEVSKDARNIKYNNLSFRLNEEDVPSEITPLIHSVNEGLSRLEEKAEAQKFFIANAAHELRTPISILKARIASLKDEKEIYLLNQDLRNINRLISQMLDMSRLDVADNLDMNQISLNDVAQKACEDMGPLFIETGKNLTLEETHHNQHIQGNEDTVFRAVLNLLENALKHTPDNTPVEVIVADKTIIVRDYGAPIPQDYKEKIFQRFEKLPENMGAKGSGLGLAIVKKAMDIHNGTIEIINRDIGNDFILTFNEYRPEV